MMNDYLTKLTTLCAKNSIPNEVIEMQSVYRENGVPTILTDGLNELLLTLKIKNPKRILELGTATGCSAIAMLKTCQNAQLVTVEKNSDIRDIAVQNFKKFGVFDRIQTIVGDSLDVVMHLPQKFDFIFLDCNKAGYYVLYPLLKDLLNSGGVIFADNIFFRDYVLGEKDCPKEYRTLVKKIDNYNQLVANDTDMITTFLNVGDGIAISVKK